MDMMDTFNRINSDYVDITAAAWLSDASSTTLRELGWA